MNAARAFAAGVSVAVAVASWGCERAADTSRGETRQTRQTRETRSTAGDRTSAPSPAGGRSAGKRAVARDFAAEAYRAELDGGGLFVDAGTLDLHKYTRGGWRTGWTRNQRGEPATRLDGSRATLAVELRAPARTLVVRGSSTGGRLVVSAGRRKLGSVALPKEPGIVRLALARPLPAGRHDIELRGARRTALDWLWFASGDGSAAAPAEPRVADGALVAPRPRAFSFYAIPTADARLRVRPDGGGRGVIEARVDGEPAVELWRGVARGAVVEKALARFSGRALRLTFTSTEGPVAWRDAIIDEPPATPVVTRGRDARNVIVLLVDTARADAFATFGPGAGVGTPAYDGLARGATAFRNAYNNENWTKPSIATLDTGLYPGTHGARWRRDRCSSELVFLSEHLRDQGFATAAFVSNISAGPKFGFDQGWDQFTKTEDASHAFGRARGWLEGRDPKKRFFLYVQTIDPHVPFSVPDEFVAPDYPGRYRGKLGDSFEQSEENALNDGSLRLGADDARYLRALYNGEIRYHDRHLGAFLDYLREKRLLDTTLFVALNDHGEEFGEHGRWGHGWTMGDALYRSPLLFHFPPRFAAAVRDEVVEHVDVAPTIADALGVTPLPAAEGQSLATLHRRPRPHAALLFGRPKKRAVRVGRYQLVVDSRGDRALFDVVADPDQQRDLVRAHPVAARLADVALGEGLGNPRRADRLSDHSIVVDIAPERIDE